MAFFSWKKQWLVYIFGPLNILFLLSKSNMEINNSPKKEKEENIENSNSKWTETWKNKFYLSIQFQSNINIKVHKGMIFLWIPNSYNTGVIIYTNSYILSY